MSDDDVLHGWSDLGGQARKFHYFPADDDTALCGKWRLSPFIADVRQKTQFSQEIEGFASKVDCVACRRKLEKSA